MIVRRTLSVILLFVFSFYAPLQAAEHYSQPSGITIKAKNETLGEIIKDIEAKSNFVFIQTGLNTRDLSIKRDIEVIDKGIEEVLRLLLKDTNVQFKVIDRQIVLFKNKEVSSAQKLTDFIQALISVSGSVVDASGMPIGGATIQLKNNTKRWVTADFDGHFYMDDIPSGSVLVVSSMGFLKNEITVDSSGELSITLVDDVQALEEVVVTSNYGTEQKRSNLVSSVFQVTTKDIENLPQQRIDKMLEGLVPGLEYMPQSDNASSARPRHSVTIRGEASLAASNEPLWIIDGTPMFTGDKTNLIYGMQTSVSPLSYINPDDIKSITVLKDASATSLYGADGANGVILITTKQGAISKPQFNVSMRSSASHINKGTKFKMLNSQQYLTLAKEAFINAGNQESLFPFTDSENNNYSTTNTDWYDQFFGTGLTSQLNVSASGGTEKATYYISGSYFNDEKTLKGNEQQRISLRSRNTINLTDRLKIDVSLAGSFNTNTLFTPGDDYYEYLPIISPYNEDGSYRMTYKIINGRLPDGTPKWVENKFFNSLAEREQNDNNQNTFALQGNLKLSYDVTNDLSYTAQVGTDYQSSVEKRYKSMYNWSGKNINGDATGYANWAHANFINWHVINRLNYSKKFNAHAISAVAGIEVVSRKNTFVGSYGSGFANDNLRTVSSASYTTGGGSESTTKSASYLGQVSYTYDNRYNLVLNVRKDGNSNFGKDVKWADFASVGASWNIHEEDFFNSNLINTLSLKGSFGSNGNSRIGRQESYGVYAINDSYQYNGIQGAGMSKGPNPNLSWETTYMTNIGLRLALFNNRLDISPEVYRNKTVNLLSNLDVSRTTGNTRVYRNVGEIENKGIEVTLQSVNILSDNFKWRTTVMASHNRNKLLKLYNSIPKNLGNIRWEEGKNINTYYLVEWAGVDPRDGYPMWYDTQGNITKEYSVANRVANKKSTPDLFGSVINNIDYKNFDLRIMTNYTIGGYAFSSFGRNVTSDGLNIMSENQSVNQLDRWQEQGDLALSPKPLWGISTQSVMNSTRFLYSKTNIKLQNISLGYSLNNDIAQSLGFKAVQFTLIGDNLIVWTPYDKADRNSYKNNMSGYPMEQTISLGLNATF
ncbi:SusC/RagA family TonB-linked outer membrane protein [Arenibacter sp. H213]|nr:SusC/RagA family TonB-linked outer membrane protein [Arenibacter sp. H213]